MNKILFFLSFILIFSNCKRNVPFIEQQDIFISGQEGSAFYRIPALITTTKGTLIAVADALIERWNDAPNNIDLAMKRSFNNGKSWTPLKIIADYPDQEAAGDACLLEDKETGTIWIFFDYIVPTEGFKVSMLQEFKIAEDYDKWRKVYLYAMKSIDDGETWSVPFSMDYLKKPDWDYLVAAPGNGIQLKNGRLLIPTYSSQSKGMVNSCQLIYSDDHGTTWKIGTSIGEYNVEPQVVDLADGTLMMNMRQTKQKGHRMYTISKDSGLTWGDIVDETSLPEPGSGCQASFIRYTSIQDGYSKDRILFSNPASTKGRQNMTIRISYDEGKTWKYSKTLHEGPSAYSCMTILPDGTIGILFEQGEQKIYEKSSFARFNLEWLTDSMDNFDKMIQKK
jgi:sialidase-1